MPTFFTSVFQDVSPVAPLGLIVPKGAEELGKQIDSYLVQWYNRDVKASKIPNSKETHL